MSRFLISALDAAGHATPALQVARSLADRGHEVLFHTADTYRERVAAVGATFVAAERAPSVAELNPEPDPGLTGPKAGVSAMRKLTVDRMAGQLADYEKIHAATPVDALLVDLCALGGHAFHERHGVPWATLGISPLTLPDAQIPPFGTGWAPPTGALGRAKVRAFNRLGARLMRPLTTAYAQQRAALGLAPLPRGVTAFDHNASDQLHLLASTPAIEYPRTPWPAHVKFVGPLLPQRSGAEAELPDWWPEVLEAETVVHVTQGTFATDPTTLTRPSIDTLADLDGLVVVSTPDPAALGPVPANVRQASFIPHAHLLPHTHAMVSNGGFNGAKMALAHGVPLVIAPWGNDQPDVAARVASAGAGIDLRTRTPEPDAVGRAVHTVLHDPSYRRAAARVRAEFDRYPRGEHAADHLEGLASSARRGGGAQSAAGGS